MLVRMTAVWNKLYTEKNREMEHITFLTDITSVIVSKHALLSP